MKPISTLALLICLSTSLNAKPLKHNSDPLLDSISHMDHQLFDIAFNQCNFELYQKIMVDGMEFYDDRTGLNTDIKKEYAAFKDKCSKPFAVTRKLIEHTVHQLGEFGAMQQGSHIFLNEGQVVQSAKFVTIWQKNQDSWVVRRAISYDHKDL